MSGPLCFSLFKKKYIKKNINVQSATNGMELNSNISKGSSLDCLSGKNIRFNGKDQKTC